MNLELQQLGSKVPSFFTSFEFILFSLFHSTPKLEEKDERTMKVKLRNR